jgi:diketogulonate reductase-like aldo/keto reductase
MQEDASLPLRPIPISGEAIPVCGLGTWKSFDVPAGPAFSRLRDVLRSFFAAGGRVVDTSPMYGQAEKVLGELLPPVPDPKTFVATKVWTRGRGEGIRQMEESLRLLRRPAVDLMQVHNLVDWQSHVPTLREWKAAGRIRYWGLTHYQASAHSELERVAAREKPDFIQVNFSLQEREAAERLLPFAADQGIAVLANRPFGEGDLFRRVRGRELPAAALAAGFRTWADLFLGYVLAHPAVTCAIPATGDPDHLSGNLAAARAPAPTAEQRRAWEALF